MVYIRVLLFFLSSFGTMELLRLNNKCKIDPFFLPSLTIAIQTTVLILAGLLNLLLEATIALYLLGFCALVYELRKKPAGCAASDFSRTYRNAGYGALLLILLVSSVCLRGEIFSHYDNFSHWALVVKSILSKNRFPNFRDTLIMFQTYPLGSSVFIYYFSKLTGSSEPLQMFAQVYIMACAVLPLFTFAKTNKAISGILVLGFVYFAFCANIHITDLLVDTLLALVGACGFAFTLLHCQKGCSRTALLYSAFYGIQLVQIKNSGIFFAALLTLAALKGAGECRSQPMRLLSLSLPWFSLLLWQKHCKYVFSNAAYAKHAMDASHYSDIVHLKSFDEIFVIFKLVVKASLTLKFTWFVVAFCALSACLLFLLGKKKGFPRLLFFSAGLYTIYQLGLFGMYIFSMTTDEAVSLPSFDRYTGTILIFIVYLNTIPILKLISDLPAKKIYLPAFSVFFFYILCVSGGSITAILPKAPAHPVRDWFESAIEDYDVPSGESYWVLTDALDGGYTFFLLEYMFDSGSCEVLDSQDLALRKTVPVHYIFVRNPENPDVKQWIQAYFPDQVGQRVIRNLSDESSLPG